ncbi:unnamed protein product [Spirodela intermedia]|uniref:Isocitrate lyase n=1 Tax=Spirodela intermedia TaxID=51605 RepID=A0A7I8IMU4_SPIIN|nr:unnamed protein product [Spirodela intermedia]CAA6658284.1 unnamed protein product [Spirodela intermedia]
MASYLAVPSTIMEEEGRFAAEVAEVEAWWRTERFRLTRRPYAAADVVALRGTLRQAYASDQLAKKLWKTLKSHHAAGTAARTFGALDPVQVTMMAKHLDTIYVSGWQCSSTHSTSNEPGPDLADYPYDTVPNKVEQLFFAQQFHDRKQREARMAMTREERARVPFVDYLKPIIADGDTGFGGATATVKLCKLFVERGAAGVHLEDQSSSTKKCGHMAGKVLVSVGEHVNRLTVLVARTDAVAATLIQTNVDARDHRFILAPPTGRQRGEAGAELQAVEDRWLAGARLRTFPDSVSDALRNLNVDEEERRRRVAEWERVSGGSHEEARAAARRLGAGEVFWDWDLPRTREGFYRFQGSVEAAIARGVAFFPHADLIWMETSRPDMAECRSFAEGMRREHPEAMLAYNLSPSFNWDASGMTDQQMREFIPAIAKLGFCWQFITLAGFHADAWRGMLAYVERIQREERRHGVETLAHQKWSGANYYDRVLKTVQGGISSTAAMGKGVTEEQFEEGSGDPAGKLAAPPILPSRRCRRGKVGGRQVPADPCD